MARAPLCSLPPFTLLRSPIIVKDILNKLVPNINDLYADVVNILIVENALQMFENLQILYTLAQTTVYTSMGFAN